MSLSAETLVEIETAAEDLSKNLPETLRSKYKRGFLDIMVPLYTEIEQRLTRFNHDLAELHVVPTVDNDVIAFRASLVSVARAYSDQLMGTLSFPQQLGLRHELATVLKDLTNIALKGVDATQLFADEWQGKKVD